MTTTPDYLCRRAALAAEPEAALDAPPWSQATWITEFTDVATATRLPPERFLHAALLWDDEALHVAWRSAPSLVPVTKGTRDDDLWTECTVELFLAAGAGYYEFELNPLGAVLDLHFPDEDDDDWRRHRAWDAPDLRWAVRSLGPGVAGTVPWAAQMRIPWHALPELSRDMQEGVEVLRAQVCRSGRTPEGYEVPAWGPVRERFCEHAAMGRVLLVDG